MSVERSCDFSSGPNYRSENCILSDKGLELFSFGAARLSIILHNVLYRIFTKDADSAFMTFVRMRETARDIESTNEGQIDVEQAAFT
jgi:hypothetical protein